MSQSLAAVSIGPIDAPFVLVVAALWAVREFFRLDAGGVLIRCGLPSVWPSGGVGMLSVISVVAGA
jgi:hypothetical protein